MTHVERFGSFRAGIETGTQLVIGPQGTRTGGNPVAPKRVEFGYDVAGRPETVTRYADLAGTKMVALTALGFDDASRLRNMVHVLPGTPVRGITVRRCVFWCDRARIFLLGHESQASAMENLLYQDCDIVHYVMTPFLLEPGEHMPLRHARFEDFRMEGDGQRDFITLRPTVNQYMRVKQPGSIQDIVFKNIVLAGDKPGPAQVVLQGADASHRVEQVTFDNVLRYGRKLEAASPEMTSGPFTADIRFAPEGK
ncbi:MAG: hypothetical protein ACYC35_21605 [Pirellulales bacterium]